ncbi:MAG TPA: hypothetical protein VL053_19445, partial [Arachidicoccus sp.]|nr:hypothetical protein [Arachidicoccus sp.]
TAEWKYTHYFDALGGYPDEFELYDLRDKNALEYDNLANDPAYKEKRKEMAELLQQQIKQKLYIKPQDFSETEYEAWYNGQQ